MKNVVFMCVHNSCRSQIAEAFMKHYAKDIFNIYSAGIVKVDKINHDAIRLMRELYNIDMSNQYSKLLTEIPKCDIVISMGCNVACPIGYKIYDDFGIEDPTGKSDIDFIKVIKEIENKVIELINKLK